MVAWKLGLYAVVIVHITLRLFTYWSVSLAAKLQFSSEAHLDRASDVLVVPKEFSGYPEIVPLQRRRLVRQATDHAVVSGLTTASSVVSVPIESCNTLHLQRTTKKW